MEFGEKIRTLRKQHKMTQPDLAAALGVSLRTLQNYETGNSSPHKQEVYQKLAELFGCNLDYLLTSNESFILDASAQYGARGAKQAQAILDQTAALFAGGELTEEDQLAFINEITTLYFDSKKRAKKIYPRQIPSLRIGIYGVLILGQRICYPNFVTGGISYE